MYLTRRHLLAGAAAAALIPSAACAQAAPTGDLPTFTPEDFGARGDGRTNDTRALARLAAAVNAAGGGRVVFRRATYVVGEQRPTGRRDTYYAWEPAPVLEFAQLTRGLTIEGNGARLRCAPGLRYGTFDPATGAPRENKMPFTENLVATPYRYMIRVADCSGPVLVQDLELDGNLDRLVIGGGYGDTGWQIAAVGLALFNNRGPETVSGVHTHHHGQDGLYIDGLDREEDLTSRLIRGVRAEYNGRQGCSIVGGRGYRFEECRFAHTGRAALSSAPGAGVDIEAENGKRNRDFRFVDCEFVDNSGSGLVADSGDSEGARFERCLFVGTTAWSAWPNKPLFRFDDCRFVGAIVAPFTSADLEEVAQFRSCEFRDDPALSSTGQVFLGGGEAALIADLSDRRALFDRCHFRLTDRGVLPWSKNAIYRNCRMEQRAARQGTPQGVYEGETSIAGNVDLYGSRVPGVVVLNGRRIARTELR
ncbi:MAG: hypothetical protein AVDCRST_MAG39-440 [uncultured Sphingomonadaceae bacterium]|uniref:Right handed beta helix domain-containing protein n=1 Tax=uncultured Sphingomonadaceae bacterium TaxID=169976 RepID=A0A6J4S8A6_9SPHN|nr:MAG: hypothetical protein AVDCRST_MAG39-440 [uncultured Sphingomonadaceae bacterium]